MRKLIKFIAVLLCFVFIVAVAAVTVVKSIFTEDRIRGYIDEAAKTYLGRDVKYDKLSLNFIGVKLTNFSVAENKNFGNKEFVKIEKFVVKVKLFPLLKKEIRVKRIVVKGVEANIVKNEEGAFNFDDITSRFSSGTDSGKTNPPENAAAQKTPLPDIILDKFVIRDSKIFYADLSQKLAFSVNDIRASAEGFNFSRAFICNIAFNAGFKDEKLDIKIPFEAVMTANLKDMEAEQADLNINSFKMSFEDMSVNGKASVKNFNNPSVSAEAVMFSFTNNTLKQFKNDLPAFVSDAKFSAKIVLNDFKNSSVNVDSFNAETGGMKISGKISVNDLDDPAAAVEAAVTSLSNNTLKYFTPDLPDFNIVKAEFTANLKLKDLKTALINVKSAQAEIEDMKALVSASVNDLTAPKIKISAGITSFSNRTMKYFAGDIPEFHVSRADLNSEISLDLEKNAAVLKNTVLSALGSKADVSGSVSWAKDVNYDIKANINFILDTLSDIMPSIAKVYEPKGKISAAARVTPDILKADVKTDNVSFKFDPMFKAEKINAAVEVNSLDNIKITELSGFLNGKKFSGKAGYFKTKDAVNVNADLDMEALILNAFPEGGETSGAGTGNKSADVKSSSLPLNLTADLKAGAIKVPYFHSDKGAAVNIRMTGITDKLDMADGNVKFNIFSGNIDDADKLAKANKITKIIFGSLAVIDRLGKALNIGALSGSNNKEGIGYDNFTGDFNFVNGKMTLQKMDFISKAVSMKASGTSDFKSDKIDMKVSLQPGVNKPVIMKITGKASEPKGTLDVAASINSIFGKEIEALLNQNKKEPAASTAAVSGVSSSSDSAVSSGVEKSTKPAASDIIKSLDSIFNKKDDKKNRQDKTKTEDAS